MSAPHHIPPSTGTERFAALVEQERIVREARYLALRATLRHNAPLPMPPRDHATAKDLRRGRMHPLGRVLWFLGILKQRNHPDARVLAERLRDLVTEAIDLNFPKADTPPARPIPFVRMKPAHGARVIRREQSA